MGVRDQRRAGGLIYGLYLIAMMLLAREGLVGLVVNGFRRMARRLVLPRSTQRSLAASLTVPREHPDEASTRPPTPVSGCRLTAGMCAGAASAEDAAPGITDTTIKVGVTGPLTGPVAAVGAVAQGIELKVAAVNAAGGVKMGDGKTRLIELVIQDDAFDPQRTLTNVRKMAERTEVFSLLGIAGTPNNQAIGRYVDRHAVPNLFMYSVVHEIPAGRGWMIGLVPSVTTEAAAFAEYLKASKPDATVGLLYLNTETGQSFRSSLEAAIEGSSVRVVAAQPVTSVDPTIDTQLSNLKASGASTLVVIAGPRQAAQAIRFAAESGWQPTTLVSNIGSSIASLKPAGLRNAKGVITSQFMKQVEAPAYADDPSVQRYLADYDAARPRFDRGDTTGQIGYVTGEALVRVLEAMQQPSRPAMMDAARNMSDVSIGLLLPGITLTTEPDGDIYPIESLQLFQFDGETYLPIGDVVSYEGKTPKI